MKPRMINIQEAKTHLSRHLEEVANGVELIIAKAGKPMAKLVPYEVTRPERRLGRLAQGIPEESADCWAPDPDLLDSTDDDLYRMGEEDRVAEEPRTLRSQTRSGRRILLDSHAVYWAMVRPEELRPDAREQLIDPANEVFFSAASIWELEIKAKKGKLLLPRYFLETLRDEHFEELSVSADHAVHTSRLPMIHQDPFDRILIAQALAEGMHFMTRDETIPLYDVPILKA